MSILHLSEYLSNIQKHVPHMFSREGIDLAHYMHANLKGKLHPPTDSFQEESDKLFFLIPGFLSSNGTLKLIGDTLEKFGSIVYAPDFPYLNTGPVEEKIELLYAKFTNIMQAHPEKKIILIGHSMGGLLAEEVARMYHNETRQKVHQIIPIGTPHGTPEIAKLIKIVPSLDYLIGEDSRKHTNDLGAIMQTTHYFSPQITRKDGLVHPDAQIPRGSEEIRRTKIHSPYQIEGTEGIRDHLWANHTNITGSVPFARSLAYH